ncbi:MAG: hypothetical protein U9R08_03570 [Nanoarchaeota archaeon]|nr:hypothetical protein [Nanoarchaeota archaeon]
MNSILIRKEEMEPFMLIGRWEKDIGFILTEYEKYGDEYDEISQLVYINEKALRKAFSNKLSRMRRLHD